MLKWKEIRVKIDSLRMFNYKILSKSSSNYTVVKVTLILSYYIFVKMNKSLHNKSNNIILDSIINIDFINKKKPDLSLILKVSREFTLKTSKLVDKSHMQ